MELILFMMYVVMFGCAIGALYCLVNVVFWGCILGFVKLTLIKDDKIKEKSIKDASK